MHDQDSWRSKRSRLAATLRHHPDADTTDLRRDLAIQRLCDAAQAAVTRYGPFTSDQKSHLLSAMDGGAA